MTKFMKLNIQLFASGSFEFTNNTGNLLGKIEWSSTSNGSEANSSTVTASLYARKVTGSTTKGQSWSGYIDINGDRVAIGNYSSSISVATSWVWMGGYTTTVPHNDDGAKSITIIGSISGPSGTTLSGITSSGSATATLDTIPRATSTINISGTIGTSISFSLNPTSSSFNHKVRLYFGSDYDDIDIPAYYQYPYAYQIPDKFYSQIPEDPSGTGSVTVYTYLNGTYIGEKAGGSLTLYADQNVCRPTGTVSMVDANSVTTNLTGNSSKIIPRYSTAKINVSAEPKKNASITNKTIAIGGVTYNIDSELSIEKVQAGNGTYTIVDSRQFPNSYYFSNETVDYADLITDFTFARLSSTSSRMYYTMQGQYWNGNFGNADNTLSIKWRVKEKYGEPSEWQDVEYSLTGDSTTKKIVSGTDTDKQMQVFIENPLSDDGAWDYQKQYYFEVLSEDSLNSFTSTKVVLKGIPIFNWYEKDDTNYFNINGVLQINGKDINL